MFMVVDAVRYSYFICTHVDWKKQYGLEVPTGWRQASWLFTSMTQELN